jgi:DNA invertase Pin-like site-specific DNA recombinase
MPNRRKPLTPTPLALRVSMLAELRDLLDRHDRLLWDAVVSFLDTGSSVEELAPALGLSRAGFYRRLTAHRDRTATPVVTSGGSGPNESPK